LIPRTSAPDFIQKIKNYRSMGTVAKINLALSALPEFTALKSKSDGNLLKGRIQISPEIDYLERAFDESKYGNFSRNPYIEIAFPSLSDPSLAPAGQHVMSIYMQYAPYKLKNSDWESQRTALGETVVKTIAQYAPESAADHSAPPDHHAQGSRRNLWSHRRPHFSRRTGARSVLHHASAARLGALQTPIDGSFYAAAERILGRD
jgi:phytoene dehydrogenase-like protein